MSMNTKVIQRLLGIYVWAFACVLCGDRVPAWLRAVVLYVVAYVARRPGRDLPVVASAACMWIGEVIAVQQPSGTWKYDGHNHQVPCWLLPLWLASASFTVDAADATRNLFITHTMQQHSVRRSKPS